LWPPTETGYSVGIFGQNWRSTYEEFIFTGGDGYVRYSRSDGGFLPFGVSSSTGVGPDPYAVLHQTATNVTLFFQNGEQRVFDSTTGLFKGITDRNGNSTGLQYDGSNRLTTVIDPASRHLYFNYGTGSTSHLVTSVTSDFGTTLSYSYDAQGRLSQVTQPDSTTITYTYNAQSQIISVTDFNGKVIEAHTYDSAGHGLTASQATEANGPAPASRDICAKGLAEEKAKSPHKILRKEFYARPQND
jgi:YD repeat-containing protein